MAGNIKDCEKMKKIIKITAYGTYPYFVHAAYDKHGNVIRYFLLKYMHDAAAIDADKVKQVMAIAKAEAKSMGLDGIKASSIPYKEQNRHRNKCHTIEDETSKMNNGVCMEDRWIVAQTETNEFGDGWAWFAATPFSGPDGLDRAKAYLEHVVRDEWQTQVIGPDNNLVLLADHKGFVSPKGSIKMSDTYYSDDGTEAWDGENQGSGYFRKICILKLGADGERVYL